jgi:hypothetical protein
VDTLSFYSEVAQAMFRLRKLNLGHKISFVLNNFYVKDNSELYNKFKINEEDLIKKQNDSMNLQALKSDIRKKRQINNDFKQNYKEKIFYYFKEEILDEDDALKYIFTEDEINEIDFCEYDLTKEIIKNLIYDINFNYQNIEIQYEQNIENAQETQVKKEFKNEQSVVEFSFSFNTYIDLFSKYKYKSFNFIKEIKTQKDYDKYSFRLDDILSFLPNIFISNSDSIFCDVNFNRIDLKKYNPSDLIFVYIHDVKKFILIPKYMVFFLYNDFLIYDMNLEIINTHKNDLEDLKIKEELEKNILVKIIMNNYSECDFNIFEESLKINKEYLLTIKDNKEILDNYLLNISVNYLYLLILFFRIQYSKIYNIYDEKIINLLNKDRDLFILMLEAYLEINEKKKENYYKLLRNKIILKSSYEKKYFKYKLKYLKLKNNLL